MVNALKSQGVQVECHVFADEGHGFRQAKNLAAVMHMELSFYKKTFQNR